MAGTSRFSKQALAVFMAFVLHFTAFTNAHAAGFGAWTINNSVAQGASVILNGSKEVILNGAKKIATGTAIIKPTAAQVSKVLARGAAGYALSIAVEQLLGAVDWVLDPANSQIRYKEKENKQCAVAADCPELPLIWAYSLNSKVKYASDAETACKSAMSFWPELNGIISRIEYLDNGKIARCYHRYGYTQVNQVVNPNYDPNVKDDDKIKTIPLETVAQKVISNAESGDAKAQVATVAAAADIVAEAETDSNKARPIINQFENTQSIPTDQTAKGDAVPKENANTENPSSSVAAPETDLTLDFPIFCDWAPSICQAAKEVIALPITLTEWWTTATTSITEAYELAKTKAQAVEDYFKNEPELDTDTELEIDEPEIDVDTDINFGGNCPAPITVPVSFATINTSIEFNYTWFCQLADFLKPIVIALSSFTAALIIGGVRQDD